MGGREGGRDHSVSRPREGYDGERERGGGGGGGGLAVSPVVLSASMSMSLSVSFFFSYETFFIRNILKPAEFNLLL